MALIKCVECGREISDKSDVCIYCGCPVKIKNLQGKVCFQTSSDFIGLLGKYVIKDKDGKTVAKLKSNDHFEMNLNSDTTFYIRYSGSFNSYKKVFVPANTTSIYTIGLIGSGTDFYVINK